MAVPGPIFPSPNKKLLASSPAWKAPTWAQDVGWPGIVERSRYLSRAPSGQSSVYSSLAVKPLSAGFPRNMHTIPLSDIGITKGATLPLAGIQHKSQHRGKLPGLTRTTSLPITSPSPNSCAFPPVYHS